MIPNGEKKTSKPERPSVGDFLYCYECLERHLIRSKSAPEFALPLSVVLVKIFIEIGIRAGNLLDKRVV